MPRVTRSDGVEIAWREQGGGPPVAIADIGYADRAPMAALIEELAGDHRVVSYDTRGDGANRAIRAAARRPELLLPDAHHEDVADGPMMRPDLTAAFMRKVRQSAAR